MFRKFQLRKLTTLLLILGTVFTSFTNAYAQSESISVETDTIPANDSANVRLFLPIVQGNSATEITAADCGNCGFPPPPGSCGSAGVLIVSFSGYQWVSRDETQDGFSYICKNSYVDANQDLHLKIYYNFSSETYCSGLTSFDQTFGFGLYEWQIYGQLEQLDPNVQLRIGTSTYGIASHYTPGIGALFTHSGVATNPIGHFFVNQPGSTQNQTFNVPLTGTGGLTTYRYSWTSQGVRFQNFISDTNTEFAKWVLPHRCPSHTFRNNRWG